VNIKELHPTADAMVKSTIADCIQHGEYVKTGKDASYELLHYQTGLSVPEARVTTNPHRPLNFVVALARWVWLMSGNSRVEDIAYYEPKVANFTDDGLNVPGSNYGARLMNPLPGVNQIEGVISRLKAEPRTRQASAVVWQPMDAVRPSKDIPCTHGMFFHVGADRRLNMAVTMRSNNAFRILPFNVFEFTMLQEYIAARLALPLGDYVHWAASMHVYVNEHEFPATRRIAADEPGESIIMAPMPASAIEEQVNLLCRLEAALRHAATPSEIDEINQKSLVLDTYWRQLFDVLSWHASARRGWSPHEVNLPDWMFELTEKTLSKMYGGN
jgi:thymidylate synthase